LCGTGAVVAIVLATVLGWGAVSVLPGREMMRWETMAVVGFVLLVFTAFAAIEAMLRRRAHAVELSAGSLGGMAIFALASAIWLRGGSYLPLIPLVAGLPALAVMIATDRELHRRRTWVLVVGGSVVVVLTLLSEVFLIHLATVPNVVPSWDPRIPTAPFAVALTSAIVAGLMPMVRILACGRRWTVPIASAIAAAGCLLMATQPWAAT
ncbi:MAG TPA: hypothetical protein PKB10_05085, partial [Tepidisphaeraceae bacterium]|nr:hypothetical protein [Tepidisphaeraceae bacterium]